jgi:microcystin-dependent protein
MSFVLSRPSYDYASNIRSPVVPIGTVFSFAGSSAPNGWMVCDGSSLSRVNYRSLYNVIGTTYGSDDGTTFNIPDLRGRTILGVGQGSGLSNRTLSQTGGAETHTLTIPEMPSHNHSGTTSTNGSHTHTINQTPHSHTYLGVQSQSNFGGGVDSSADDSNRPVETTSSTTISISLNENGDHAHTISSQGSSLPHNNMQPFMALNYIIKYKNVL